MVQEIADLKNEILKKMRKEVNERGIDRADTKELGELADIVKDLAEAEKACWEAEYYMSVSEAMDSQGYTPMNAGSYSNNTRAGYRDSRGRYARRGYTSMGYHDGIESIRTEMNSATPEEREKMQRELRSVLGM